MSWAVECPAYSAGPFPSEGAARQWLAYVDKLGACMYDHDVRESA